MTDGFGRTIDYLRISVTDKCNLRCKYCMPPEGVEHLPHEEVLTLEEIARLAKILAGLGIRKVRLTGGEPRVRKNLLWLVKALKEDAGIEEVAMTTNGILFAPQARAYREAGLDSINISLDTLEEDEFAEITGKRELSRVLAAMDAAYEQGLKVKINCVPVREWNEEQLVRLALLAKDRKTDVRFIELMPIGCGKKYEGIPSEEILEKLERVYGKAEEQRNTEEQENAGQGAGKGTDRYVGPARYVRFPGFAGKIGFISPLSHKFCSECNRIRLTCEGRLKLCLHYQNGVELKPLLRSGASDEEIAETVREAVLKKPHFKEQYLRENLSEEQTKGLEGSTGETGGKSGRAEKQGEAFGGRKPGEETGEEGRKMVQIGG